MFTLTVKTASVFVTEVFMEKVFEANASGLEHLIRGSVFPILASMVDHV